MEHSFGIIPLSYFEKEIKLFLVQHRAGHFAFPKGKPEQGETPRMTAERELFEESGLHVTKWLRESPFTEKYQFYRGKSLVHKEVSYFPALVHGEVVLQAEEIKDGRWFSFEEAENMATFPEMKRVVQDAFAWFRSQTNV
jgi:bis(5'-nucleosidyl)-tetraphosphatase